MWPEVDDIEDFVRWGEDNVCCPYFLAKEQQGSADVVFMPYNYILDPLIRKTLTLGVKNTVIILDEAHNVESVASDSTLDDPVL
jgi:regulator of telomere elongation helicase 1